MTVQKDASATGLRPPYLTTFQATDQPLIVLPAFLSRADSTPQAARPRDPNNVVGRDGKPLPEPAADPSALAFEPDPNLAYEKWDEYWRKVHGMRFTYEDGPDDKSMAVMLRYDQVHRLPGGPTSHFPPPYYAPVDEQGRLHSKVIGKIAAYKRPLYDGFAYMAFHSLDDLTLSFGSGKFPAKIVPEEQVMFRSVPHMISKEYILIASPTHRDPVSLVKVHTRAAGTTRDDFQKRWLYEHADLLVGKAATHQYVRRYAQLHNVGPAKEGDLFWHPVGSRWDGVTVMSFAGVTDLEDYLMTDDHAAVEAAERQLTDPAGSEYWTAVNYNIINRLYPERVTRR
ncbi:MAG: EthD domain-containing protein [Gemmataceae bacterium]|nr:EthD domain-containing protein [Gemmataceae bacterium]